MPRIRTVKPAYPKNRKVRSVSRDARLLNIHLWNLADDEGRLQELPQWIIGEVFPTDEDVTPVVLREWLGSLHDADLIVRYEVDGERYIACQNFTEHQVINKPRESDIPAPDAGIVDSGTTPVVLPEDSHPEREEEGKGNGRGKGRSGIEIPDAPLSDLLASLVAENTGKAPTISKAWIDAERLMLDKDGRDRSEAERLIRWTAANEFWRANVLSLPKFREKYDQLLLTAKRGGSAKKATTGTRDRSIYDAKVEAAS
jgi:hypothetical protein